MRPPLLHAAAGVVRKELILLGSDEEDGERDAVKLFHFRKHRVLEGYGIGDPFRKEDVGDFALPDAFRQVRHIPHLPEPHSGIGSHSLPGPLQTWDRIDPWRDP